MSDASLELQGAIVARLKAYAPLAALIGTRVYDDVPRAPGTGAVTAAFPFVSYGPDQVIPDGWDCQEASEIIVQIDAWSRAVGLPEVKRIADLVRRALHDEDIALADNALLSLAFDGRRVLRDPDGLTSHAVITFRALVEHD